MTNRRGRSRHRRIRERVRHRVYHQRVDERFIALDVYRRVTGVPAYHLCDTIRATGMLVGGHLNPTKPPRHIGDALVIGREAA